MASFSDHRPRVRLVRAIGAGGFVQRRSARFGARTEPGPTLLADLYCKTFLWLAFDEETALNVADIPAGLGKFGARARRTNNRHPHRRPRPFDTMRWWCTTTPTS